MVGYQLANGKVTFYTKEGLMAEMLFLYVYTITGTTVAIDTQGTYYNSYHT